MFFQYILYSILSLLTHTDGDYVSIEAQIHNFKNKGANKSPSRTMEWLKKPHDRLGDHG